LRAPSGQVAFLLSAVAALAAWWAVAAQVGDQEQVASPLSAGQALLTMFADHALLGQLAGAIESTLGSVLLAFLLAAAVGVPAGLLMGRYLFADLFLDPWVKAWYSIPAIAFVPMAMNWMGITWMGAVLTGFLLAVFSVILSVYSGAREVSAPMLEPALSYGASQAELMSKVVLPASLPSIMVGLRLGMARALEGVIIAEMTFSVIGLGGLLDPAADRLHLAQSTALILVLAVISVALSEAMKWANRKAVPWKEADAVVRKGERADEA
jgi:ABC-type nitrate/sulfonate/bicarbonate transport system permease component